MKKILIVDDDPLFRTMINDMLASENYAVLEASNGNEALDVIIKDPEFDLVILDIVMPEKEGLETIREIKKDFSNLKILAISGGGRNSTLNYLELAKGFGANLTLKKPFLRKELLDLVYELLKDSKKYSIED